MGKLKVAVQVYSVREDAERDFKGTIREIKSMGYDGVELAGLYGLSPEEVGGIIKSEGLVPISAHVPYDALAGDTETVVGQYKTIGCSYIAVPYLTDEYRPGAPKFPEVIENIRRIGEVCKNNGITLLYHNHDFEFVKMDDGRYGLDYLFDSIPPELLETEIDICWVRVSDVNPADYILKYTGRCPIVHLKDYVGQKSDGMYKLIGIEGGGESGQEFQFRAVGYGCQDIPPVIESAVQAGAGWVVVEQDNHYTNPAMEDIRISLEYLKKIGV